MSIGDRPIESIDQEDLKRLIADGVDEQLRIEYKAELQYTTNGGRKELLRDVSSFANTAGGDIFFGISETKGRPSRIDGIHVPDPDKCTSTLEQMIRDGLEPKLSGHRVRPIPLESGQHVIVVRIPRSYAAPHRVSFQSMPQFWARRTNGKYYLDANELRNAFLLSETAADKIRGFRADRVGRLLTGERPVVPQSGPKMVFHLIPLDAFHLGRRVDLRTLHSSPSNLGPVSRGRLSNGANPPNACRFNLDGFLAAYVVHGEPRKPIAYCQWYWNGIVESYDPVDAFPGEKEGVKELAYGYVENDLPKSARRLLDVQQKLGVHPPIVALLTLCDVRNYVMKPEGTSYRASFGPHHPIDRDHLFLPEVMIESFDSNNHVALRPIIDGVWNATGYAESPVKKLK